MVLAALPPLPKGLCLGEDCGKDELDVGRMPAGQGDFVRWDGDQLVVIGEGTLSAYDMMGRLLLRREIENGEIRMRNSDFPGTGSYILCIGGQSKKNVIQF